MLVGLAQNKQMIINSYFYYHEPSVMASSSFSSFKSSFKFSFPPLSSHVSAASTPVEAISCCAHAKLSNSVNTEASDSKESVPWVIGFTFAAHYAYVSRGSSRSIPSSLINFPLRKAIVIFVAMSRVILPWLCWCRN